MKNLLWASAEEIHAYFENSSNRIGMQLLPSERVIDVIGNYLLNDTKQVNNAIALFELNVSNYPNSYHAYYSLAEALKQKGEETSACEYYKKSLVLKPSNVLARKALEDISGNN